MPKITVLIIIVIMTLTDMSRYDQSPFMNGLNRVASSLSSAAASIGKYTPNKATTHHNNMGSSHHYSIRVVDDETNRGIPLVYLRTTFKTIHVTDSAGYVAYHEPGLMNGGPVWFTLNTYGYDVPLGGFGQAGLQIHPKSGESVEIRLKRTQVAQRLYRMTGYGVYRDSVLLGKPVPIKRPILNAMVTGSDTIQCAKYQGKLFWMWQDTDQVACPLGNFNMTGATTALPEFLDPERGLNFHYFTPGDSPKKFARTMVNIELETKGNFPLWVDGLTVVPDTMGREYLIGRYYASGPGLGICIEEGLVIWNDEEQMLERLVKFDQCNALAPMGHTIYVRDNGTRYAYYGKNVRVKADYESASDPSQYEAFTCLSRDGKKARRGLDGTLIWSWVKGGIPVNYETTPDLVKAGIIKAEESPYRLKDIESGKAFEVSQVGIAWNPYLNLWVNIVQEKMGETLAGEIWFSTAHAPEGPWSHARKVATHFMNSHGYTSNSNDFYNPVQHYELMREGGRIVYFSGTFVNTFSGNPWSTPYYNYNNILYKLELNDTRLSLPPPPKALWNTVPDDF